MPQFDLVTFYYQLIGLVVFFSLFYYIYCYNYIHLTSSFLKIRSKKINEENSVYIEASWFFKKHFLNEKKSGITVLLGNCF